MFYKYLDANNRLLNKNDEYQYKPSQKDIDMVNNMTIDNLGDYKGILQGDNEDTESYLYKLYKESLR